MSMSNNGPLRPQFWVLRYQTNSMVPLVAIDELPPTINIRGVPRSLEANDLAGMTCAGAADSRHRTYIVDMPNEPTASRTPPTANGLGLGLNASLFASSAYAMRPMTNPNIFPQPPKAYGISEQMPSHIKSPATGDQLPASPFPFTAPLRVDRNPGPNPLPPWQDATSIPMKAAPGVKEYCSYWLRCGECDYAQQGCLYKHEMPLDRDVLERLGHRDIPKWYREKHGLGSFLAGGGIGAEKGERVERSWRNVGEVEEREGDGGRARSDARVKILKKTDKLPGAGGRVGRNIDKRAMLWRDEWEKKRDGRFAPKSSDPVVVSVSPLSSPPPPIKTSPVRLSPVKLRGPASRALSTMPAVDAHYRSPLARKTDEDCLAALEVDMYAKRREREELIRLRGHAVLVPGRWEMGKGKGEGEGEVLMPESGNGGEESEGDGDDGEWVEGDAVSQARAISNDAKVRGEAKGGR